MIYMSNHYAVYLKHIPCGISINLNDTGKYKIKSINLLFPGLKARSPDCRRWQSWAPLKPRGNVSLPVPVSGGSWNSWQSRARGHLSSLQLSLPRAFSFVLLVLTVSSPLRYRPRRAVFEFLAFSTYWTISPWDPIFKWGHTHRLWTTFWGDTVHPTTVNTVYGMLYFLNKSFRRRGHLSLWV